jgi:hypothetical protein
MKPPEMAKFLKSEGWGKGSPSGYIDPKYLPHIEAALPVPLDRAYRLALKRKQARDSRRLKAAGWVTSLITRGMWFYGPKRAKDGVPTYLSRAEALSTLEAP